MQRFISGSAATWRRDPQRGPEPVPHRAPFAASGVSPPVPHPGIRRMGHGDVCPLTENEGSRRQGEDRLLAIK